MKRIAKVVSALAFVGTIAPALLFFSDRLDLAQMKTWMLVATFVWFVATPVWMDRPESS
jgi:hypothetical protein